MRFVGLVLAVAVFGAGVGFVSVGTAQAHGGDGGGAVEVMEGYASCPVVVAVQATVFETSCTNLTGGGGKE